MELRRRIGAYGVCRDDQGRVLVVRASARSVRPGTWFLPGGGVEHGEHPADAVVRELAEETGLAVTITGLRGVSAEIVARPPGLEHTDGVIYDVAVTGGDLRPERDGTSDAAQWRHPWELAGVPLSGFAARALDLPVPPQPAATGVDHVAPRRGARGQRFGAYGVATDPQGRVLLTRVARGFPGAGRWHLPGGGTDFGEQPVDGLLREIAEESGQVGQAGDLVAISHHHNPAAWGPEGHPIDWHGVRAVFAVHVPEPTVPLVQEVAGSTAEARWCTRDAVAALPLTDLAGAMLREK